MDVNNTSSSFTNSSSTGNVTTAGLSAVFIPFVASWSDVFIAVVQWVIFVLGTIGNVGIVAVLMWRRSKAQLVTQLFIGSLSLAGLALMLSSGWVNALYFVENNWRCGQLCCQVQYYIQTAAIPISICTLAALSVERQVSE